MQGPTILFLPFHGFGHFNGLFGVARDLSRNHQVVFAGNDYFEKYVIHHGFEFRSLSTYPFGIGLEEWTHQVKKSKDPVWASTKDRWSDKMYHDRVGELSKLISETKPSHVLIDAQQATDVIVLKAIDAGLRVSVVSTPPPYLLIPGLPPINSTAMPGHSDDAYKRALEEIDAKVWRQKKKYLGMDDRRIVDRRLKENKMEDLREIYTSLITFAAKVTEDVKQFVLTYREFDFHHEYLDRFHYVGPHFDSEYREPNTDKYKEICEESVAKGRKLIYCSFGTVESGRSVVGFLGKLNKACASFNCTLIVANRKEWIPQAVVLRYADVFITHGGINSIHDAIRLQVPMLVYPLDQLHDQNGNSSRVIYNNLGLRGNIDIDTEEDIQKKLKQLFTNRNRFTTFKRAKYPIDNFVKLIV